MAQGGQGGHVIGESVFVLAGGTVFGSLIVVVVVVDVAGGLITQLSPRHRTPMS